MMPMRPQFLTFDSLLLPCLTAFLLLTSAASAALAQSSTATLSGTVEDEKGAVVIQADAVGGAEAGGEDVGARAVGAYAKEGAVMGHDGVESMAR